MTAALALGLAAAGFNVAASRALARKSERYGWGRGQGLGLLLRCVVLFGVAQALWLRRGRTGEVAAFLVTAALAQLAGQAWLLLSRERADRARDEASRTR